MGNTRLSDRASDFGARGQEKVSKKLILKKISKLVPCYHTSAM